MHNPQDTPIASPTNARTHFVHSTLRLLRIVHHRKANVLACLMIAVLLGTLYFFTASRKYEAGASLMILYRGNEDSLPRTDGYRQSMLPTYERLLYSSVVLDGAAELLGQMPPEARVDLVKYSREKWVDVLRGNLSARSIRSTNFIELRYQSVDPQTAVTVVNAIVQSYLDFIDKNQRNVATEIVAILDKGRADVARQLNEKETLLLQAKRQIGDLGLRDGSAVTHPLVHNVVRINESLMEMRQKRMRLEASLASVRQAISQGRDLRQYLMSLEDAAGRDMILGVLGMDAHDEEIISQIERKLVEERARLNSVREHYGDAHPIVADLRQSIQHNQSYLSEYRSARSKRLDQAQNRHLASMLLSMLESELATILTHEETLHREFVQAQRKAVELNGQVAQVAIIEHDLRLLRDLHDTLRNRIANLDIRQDQAEVRVAVVSEAEADESPVSPRPIALGFFCIVGGLALGGGTAYILDVLDDRFRSADELKEQLGVSVLAIVRQLPVMDASGLDSLQVYVAPDGVESEAFRTLRTTLAFSEPKKECIAISSSEPGDGKTTVLANLGAAAAQAGKRTLLIDGDMRRPGLSRLFGLRGVAGLAEILREHDEISQMAPALITASGLEGLDVLSSGAPPSDPSSLLASDRLSQLVAWADGQYDLLLIDTPPILAASDAAIIGRLTDGIVLVVQPAKNHRRMVYRAVDQIRSVGLTFVGIVANRISSADDDYYGYGYGYGHGYGGQVGEDDPELEDVLEFPSPNEVDGHRRAA